MAEKGVFTNESLRNRVADHIRREILLGETFSRGEHLVEIELAERLDISRSTLREALKELESQGLVRTIPRKGTYVSDFDHEDFMEIYELRFLLESSIYGMLISQKILNRDDFDHLKRIVDEMVEITSSGLPEQQQLNKFNDLDIEFHSWLWKRSGKKWFIQMLRNIFYQLRLAMLQDLILEDNMESSATMHYHIIHALEEEDLDGAKKHLSEHILAKNISKKNGKG